MSNNPAVSVIVPMYKVEQYIKFCVDSILAQTFKDFEIIIVDDASPDNCFKLCKKLYGGNRRVRIVRHEKNLGLGPARNTGMKHARGKYVYFVDSDDYILPHALEKLYTTAEKTNAQVVRTTGHYKLYQEEAVPVRAENLKLIWAQYNQEGFIKNDIFFRLEELWKKMGLNPAAWCGFYRRDFLETNQIQFLSMFWEDVPFHMVVLGLAERYYLFHDAVYVYRIRENSIMTAKNLEKISRAINAMFVGSIYTEKFLQRLLDSEKNNMWRDSLVSAFFDTFLIQQTTMPFYRDLKAMPEINATVKDSLKKFFGDSEPFIRYFFNNYHLFRRQSEILLQQRNALLQQNQQLKNLTATFIREQPALLKLMETVKSDAKKIFLLGTPDHGNLGDQAIALGELRVIKEYFPQYEIVEIPYNYFHGEFDELLQGLGLEKYVRQSDVIFLHGGGNLGNLWLTAEQVRRRLIEKFPDKKIVIFPQSIFFTNDDAGRRELAISQKVYNSHKDLHLMTRDENSFNLAKGFFPQINNYLMPDAATVLQGIVDDADIERKGVLFVLRGDKEKVRDDDKIQRLQKYLTAKNIPFTVADTVIKETVTSDNRERKIRDVLMKFRAAKVVITDRFHGVVFSFITRTPVMAFKSFDTKISSGIRWFKNLPSIFYAEDQDFSRMEKFIDEYYFASAEEEISAALTVKVDTDSRERFMRALNKIIGANKIYPIELSAPLQLN